MSTGSNGTKDEGWEVASSRKARHQTGNLNVPTSVNWSRGAVSSSAVAQDRGGSGGWKGKSADGQKPGRWDDGGRNRANPRTERDQSYRQSAWKEVGKAQTSSPRNGSADNRAPRNDGRGHVKDEGNTNQAWQRSVKLSEAESGESANAKTGRADLAVPPPLANGWQWGARGSSNNPGPVAPVGPGKGVGQGTSGSGGNFESGGKPLLSTLLPFEQSGESSSRAVEAGDHSSGGNSEPENTESDDEFLSSDEYDSDASDVSHETLKKNKWFKSFFASLDGLSLEAVNEPERQWHCPACKGGVGAIDWYKGMQPIITHAKTIRSKRVKLHRKLAEVLEEELRRRGAACLVAEEMFGKWKGLREPVNNQEIVWPPIVIIQNTVLDQDENEQWIGMGNKELLEYFKGYKAAKARHAYGPKGHRGISVLIFEDSAMGYLEAERLHKHFLKEGRGKDDWERRRILFHPGGKRVLYGYLATKEEMEIFNRHSKVKAKLKYEMRSYHSMVVEPMRQMNEDNQNLIWLKTKVAKEQEHSRTLEETVSIVAKKLRMREDEIKIIRQRATEQHEECKKEMDSLELNYRQQIDQLYDDVARREQELEKMQEESKMTHLDRCHQLEVDSAKLPKDTQVVNDEQQEQQIKIEKEIARQTTLVESSFKESEEYERERQELIKAHDERRKETKLRQLQEEVALEKELEKERVELLEKYAKRRQAAEYIAS